MQMLNMAKRAEKTIIKRILAGQFVLTVHARERMNERFVSELDIVEVAKTIKSIEYQKHNDTYLLIGLDTWREKLMVSTALRGGVIIVTVFFEE